jgi:hypothetical protein
VYIAALKKDSNGISIFTLSEHFTAKYIKSSQSLKAAIEYHFRSRPLPMYDDWFVLKNLQRIN